MPVELGRGARALILAAIAAIVVAVVAIASCGGGSEEEAKRLLDRGFGTSIGSATVAIDAELKLEGIEGLQDPIRLKLNGPYQSNGEGRDASFDWDISLTLGGQPVAFKFISTGDGTFVSLAGTNYKVGDQAGDGENTQDRSFSQLGLNPREWVKKAETKGEETVGGVKTEHVSGTFDVRRFLRDLNEAAGRAGNQFGGQAPVQLTPQQIEEFASSIDDPRFDAYVGKDDGRLHRLSTDLTFGVPERDRGQLGGASGGRLSFSVEFSDIGRRFTVRAPANARPISDLQEQLAGLGNLGGIGGGGGGGGGAGGGSDTPPGTAPGSDIYEQYSDCLEQADPSDTEAIQDCAQLVR